MAEIAEKHLSEIEKKTLTQTWKKCINQMEALLSDKIEGEQLSMDQRVEIKIEIQRLRRKIANIEILMMQDLNVPSSMNFDNKSHEELMNESLLREYTNSEGTSAHSLLEAKILEKMKRAG